MITQYQQGLVSQTQLDAIAEAVAHIYEFRLTSHLDIPGNTHKTIRHIGTDLRDDIKHGKCLAHVVRSQSEERAQRWAR